jgi:hypothetical protein
MEGPRLAGNAEGEPVGGEVGARVVDHLARHGDLAALDQAGADAPRSETLGEKNLGQLHARSLTTDGGSHGHHHGHG